MELGSKCESALRNSWLMIQLTLKLVAFFPLLRQAIFTFVAILPYIFFVPETHAPTIVRRVKGQDSKRSFKEIASSFWSRFKIVSTRPILFAFTEPLVAAIGLYLSLLYVIIYSFFEGKSTCSFVAFPTRERSSNSFPALCCFDLEKLSLTSSWRSEVGVSNQQDWSTWLWY